MIKEIGKIILAGIIGGLVVVGVSLVFTSTPNFSGTTHLSGVTIGSSGLVLENGGDVALGSSSTLTVGPSGTALTQVISGTCNFIGMDASQTASTTVAYDCAVTGVVAGDKVILGTPTTTPTTFLGWNINGASASSTSGYITAYFTNMTGANAIPSAGKVGSSTPYIVIR